MVDDQRKIFDITVFHNKSKLFCACPSPLLAKNVVFRVLKGNSARLKSGKAACGPRVRGTVFIELKEIAL